MSRHLLHFQNIQKLIADHVDFVSVVITAMKGSAPQEPGAKMLVTKNCGNHPYEGTIGGGKLELFAINHAKNLLANDTKQTTDHMELNLQSDIGMTCGGVVQLFFEVYQHNQWHIAVFGAGHVAQALIPILLTFSCHVHCIDPRNEWLQKLPDHPALNKINEQDISQVLLHLPEGCFIVSVTQGHCEDVKIIEQVFNDRTPPFVGIIGSDSKAAILKKELLQLDVDPKLVAQIHCPIGLPLGQDTPAEIAISISAQLLQIRDHIQ